MTTLSIGSSIMGRSVNPVRKASVGWRLRNALRWSYLHGLLSVWLAKAVTKVTGLPFVVGEWRTKTITPEGLVIDHGVVCRKLLTNVALGKFADALHNNSFDLSMFKYGAIGTGTTAPAAGDTTLVTESTTALLVDNTRALATSTKPTTTSVLKTALVRVDADVTVSEFGIFDQAATGGGNLIDRGTQTGTLISAGGGFQVELTVTFTR